MRRFSLNAWEHRADVATIDAVNGTAWLTGATSAGRGQASDCCICGWFKTGSRLVGACKGPAKKGQRQASLMGATGLNIYSMLKLYARARLCSWNKSGIISMTLAIAQLLQ